MTSPGRVMEIKHNVLLFALGHPGLFGNMIGLRVTMHYSTCPSDSAHLSIIDGCPCGRSL